MSSSKVSFQELSLTQPGHWDPMNGGQREGYKLVWKLPLCFPPSIPVCFLIIRTVWLNVEDSLLLTESEMKGSFFIPLITELHTSVSFLCSFLQESSEELRGPSWAARISSRKHLRAVIIQSCCSLRNLLLPILQRDKDRKREMERGTTVKCGLCSSELPQSDEKLVQELLTHYFLHFATTQCR